MSSLSFQVGLQVLLDPSSSPSDLSQLVIALEGLESVFGKVKIPDFKLLVDTPEERTRREIEVRVSGVFVKIANFCREHKEEFKKLTSGQIIDVVYKYKILERDFSEALFLSDFTIQDICKGARRNIKSGR